MATISEMLDRWKAVDLKEIATEAVEEQQEQIVDLNREQMNEGIRADGSPIKPSYTPFTKFLKSEKGQRVDVVTLRDTGTFQSKMFIKLVGNGLTVGSTDNKTDSLRTKYGKIFGLDKQSTETAAAILQPPVVRKIADLTGCKIS